MYDQWMSIILIIYEYDFTTHYIINLLYTWNEILAKRYYAVL